MSNDNKKIAKYIHDNASEELKPFINNGGHTIGENGRGCFLSNGDDFLTIAESYITWWNKKKEAIINNVYEIYKLTGNETGYDALSCNWEHRREAFPSVANEEMFSKEDIKKQIEEEMSISISHLYQKWGNKNSLGEDKCRVSNIGLLVVSSIFVEYSDDGRRDDIDLIFTHSVSLEIDAQERHHITVPR
jgi:hypothetical protein